MSGLNLSQAIKLALGRGYMVILPPAEEEAARGIIGLITVRLDDGRALGEWMCQKGQEATLEFLKALGTLDPRIPCEWAEGEEVLVIGLR